MKNQAEEIRSFILTQIPAHPGDIVAVAAAEFSVSRTTVHRHLKRLIKGKKIIKSGTTNRAVYFLFSSKNKIIKSEIKQGLEEYQIWRDNLKQDFISLNKNVFEICEYGFTEIFNNAIDHSEGSLIVVQTEWTDDAVRISIVDDGIGIFKKIKTSLNLENERESILQLSKGKFTTSPETHTGEGIFFTSRAFDEFFIFANGLSYHKSSLIDDWFIETIKDKHKKGTMVSMKIGFASKRSLKNIFEAYTNPHTYQFDKTHILVELSKLEDENYISRSQAKRLLFGLEKFHDIVLDFKDIVTVGQGFVDEVFRVFKQKYPTIKITRINANDDVQFMISRSIAHSNNS
ncbi:MAG: DUF4325 domain-containing protein [Planctomycetota bacterium]|nr:DUF4325 domain-containing protein [Planctomycetota bacterium]